MNNFSWQNQVTLLVNSCDAYADLWDPFFTLLKRYFVPLNMPILLNTESKAYHFDGLEIKVVHSAALTYGERMRDALRHITSEYVLLLLDDFFLRKPVDMEHLREIIQWMNADTEIVYFNSDVTNTVCDIEVNRYPGYRRLPAGNRYTLNLQAAVWRTEKLYSYWKYDVSPWDWEERCNVLTANSRNEKFYCALSEDTCFLDYGRHSGQWMGICHGKWVENDVVPLFKKENIQVDFQKRGFVDLEHRPESLNKNNSRHERYQRVKRCLGSAYLLPYFFFCRRCNLYSKIHRCAVDEDYFHYLQRKADARNLKGRKILFAPMVR